MKILIVTEQKRLADSVEPILQSKGLETEIVQSGEIGAEYAELGIYDLMVLDNALEGKSGYEISRRLRMKHCRLPIVLLTEDNELENRIKGLKSGVDYSIVTDKAEEPFYGNTRLILSAGKLVCGDQSVRLSAKEFDVMRLLLQTKDRLLSKEVILARVWGYDSNAVENHVEVYVGFLRKKLRSIDSNLEIKAVRRMGYTLEIKEE